MAVSQSGPRGLWWQQTAADCAFLSGIVALSVSLYIRGLGFYSDDWWLLGRLVNAPESSLAGALDALTEDQTRMRPAQLLYFALLYRSFGLDPLGYHLANAVVFAIAIVLFHVTLRELSLPRVMSLAVPAVYALLPHYSTNRFFYAAFGANLSMALFFLSAISDLRAVRGHGWRMWTWKAISLFALVVSVLSYEIFLPLFLASPFMAAWRARQLHGSEMARTLFKRDWPILIGTNLVALAMIVEFKILTTNRGGFPFGYWEWLQWLVPNVVTVNYGDLLLELPTLVWAMVWSYPDGARLVLALVLGIVIPAYLFLAGTAELWPSRTAWLKAVLAGVGVFVLGYAIFLANVNVYPTPFAAANRTAIAAALGLALSLVGAIGWLASFFAGLFRRACFSLGIAVLSVCGFLVIDTIASFWTMAYERERAILADVRQRFPILPSETTFILDGVCPYVGPAVVFDSYWDLMGALSVLYADLTLKADIVTPTLVIKEDGLSTRLYSGSGAVITHYRYGDKVLIYHFGRKLTARLADAAAARRYFATINPSLNADTCPPGAGETGSPIFDGGS